MDIIRLCAWGYAALLGFVILTGYIPAFIDQNDMIFGLFRRTWYADGLHLVSALWALTAALTSRRASELSSSCSAPSTSPTACSASSPEAAISISVS
jgi:hypothetical protein